LETIRNQLKLSELDMPVIVITAFGHSGLETKAYRYGAAGCYMKGESIGKLLNMVKVQTGRVRSKYHE